MGSKWNFAWWVIFRWYCSSKIRISSKSVKLFQSCGGRNLPIHIDLAIGLYTSLYYHTTRDYYYYYYHFRALYEGLPGCASTRRNIHPLTWPDHHPSFIIFFHLQQSIASCLFDSHASWSFCTTSVQVLVGLPVGLEPSTSYSIHFFTQSVSSFRNTCPHHRSLFWCSTKIILSILSLSLNSLLGTLSFTLTSHIHLAIFISVCWSATSFSFLTG